MKGGSDMLYPNETRRFTDEHRHELLREAQRERLAAQVRTRRDGFGDRALLFLAAALARGAERARISYAHRRLARLHAGVTSARCLCPAGASPACAYPGRS